MLMRYKSFIGRPLVLLTACCALIQTATAQRALPEKYAGRGTVNYLRSWDALAPEQNADSLKNRALRDVRETTQYIDGLGRPLQTVVKKGSLVTGGSAKDLVSSNIYNDFGLPEFSYLPFVADTVGGNSILNDGTVKVNPFQQQAAFMQRQYGAQGETYFYGRTVYEASPLSRELKSLAPGNSWVGADRGVRQEYSFNDAIGEPSVKVWRIDDTPGSLPYIDGIYGTGQLRRNAVYDEHDNLSFEYIDKQGKTVLKSMPVSGDWLITFYVYDDIGRLRAVIPPKAVPAIWSNWVMTQGVMDELCFRYEYDARGRMIVKKVPGAGEVRMVYDARDRLVLSQDANIRTAHQWMYTQYDELNRAVATGLITDNTNYNNRGYHASAAASSTAYPNLGSYTAEELTRTFYDDYDWLSVNGNPFPATRNTDYDGHLYIPSNITSPYPQALSQNMLANGLVTGTKTRVLGTNTFLYGIVYYDERQRVIQTINNNITGWTDAITTQYDFAGKVLVQTVFSGKDFSEQRIDFIKTRFEYDELGRVLNVFKKPYSHFSGSWKGDVEEQIVQNQYDVIGQLKQKKLAPAYNSNAGLETENFDYNIRGWMLGMNRDYAKDANNNNYFGFDLGYDKANNGIIGSQSYLTPQYNGNIGGMVWKSKGDGEKRKYDFLYDEANRLLKADFSQYTSGSFNKNAGVDFSVSSMSYDLNGNILNMTQKGLKLTSSSIIDSLIYGYESNSNKLAYVTDKNNDASTKLGDFKEINNNTTTDYSYDGNGNLTLDNNKAISSITYNHLNLPSVITVTSKGTITYTYDATGNKLKKVTVDNTVSPSVTTTTLYIGGSVYENDVLQFIGHEEGRMRFRASDNTFQFDYMLKDHLGNVRAVLTEEQQTDAYPAATMETANATTEEIYYSSNVANTRVTLPAGYPANTPPGNARVAKVSGSGYKIGPGIILKVMAGDKFHLTANSWYKKSGSSPGTPVSPLSELVVNLLNTVGYLSNLNHGPTVGELESNGTLTPGATAFLASQTTTSGKPNAYVNWLLLDEQFNFVSSSSGFEMVGADDTYTTHTRTNMPVDKSGYLYIYVSNETPNIDVFFDNLQVTHVRGPLVEEAHYYPFGLTMKGISSRAVSFGNPENKSEKFQSQPLDDDLGVNYYGFKWRNHDPQIGRFIQIDPLSDKYVHNSTYAFSENKVVAHVELEGLESVYATMADAFRRDGITKSVGDDVVRKFKNVTERAGRVSKDILTVAGGVTLMIASGGTAAPLLAFTSGVFATAGGTTKLILDAQGDYEQADLTPTTISGSFLMTINEMAGKDKNGKNAISKEFLATIETVEGMVTLNFKDLGSFDDLSKASNNISGVTLSIDVQGLPKDIQTLIQNAFKPQIVDTNRSNTPVSDHSEDTKWKRDAELRNRSR